MEENAGEAITNLLC